jgi:maltose/moltooligosaccharide transporter
MLALVCGSLGLFSVYFINNPWLLMLSMVGVGIAWASILSMPYAILSGALPAARMGVYMGVFNFFIVIPEIIQALTFGPAIRLLFGENNPQTPIYLVTFGGACLLVAALLVVRVQDVADLDVPEDAVILADQEESLLPPFSVQPVPSTGLIDEPEGVSRGDDK